MEPDVVAMLGRVLADVFDDRFDVAVTPGGDRWEHRARVEMGGSGRSVVLRANLEWFGLGVPELNVGTFLLDYDEDAAYKEAILRELALVAHAYLRGQGHVEWRRSLFRRRPVLLVDVDGRRWELGRRAGRAHYPDD